MRIIDADELLKGKTDHEMISTHLIYNAPTVDVLDKIRAEIDELETYYDNDYFSGNRDAMFKYNDVMQIIDHYMKGE